MAGAALFHGAGHRIDVQRPQVQQAGAGKGERLRGHVVDVAHQLHDLAVCLRPLSPPGRPGRSWPVQTSFVPMPTPTASTDITGMGPKDSGEVGQQGRPGGCAELPLDRAAIDGHARQEVGRGGGGHRHHAVGAAHRAASHMDGGDHNPFRLKQMQGVAHARHVGHRVQSPHLVEVDVAHRAAVGLGLRHRQSRRIPTCACCLTASGSVKAVDDAPRYAPAWRWWCMAWACSCRMRHGHARAHVARGHAPAAGSCSFLCRAP